MSSRKLMLSGLMILVGLVLIPLGLFSAPIIEMEWKNARFESQARDVFQREVSYIEVQPDSGHPAYRIVDSERIDKFREWVLATQYVDRVRSAPPPAPAVHDVELGFADGSVETMKLGPFLEPSSHGFYDEVSISWRTHYRVGPRPELASILSDSEQNGDP